MLAGYPSSLYLLAIANKFYRKRVRPRAIYTASETLLAHQRDVIEQSFACKVYVWYGNSEMCGNIVECEKGRYHLKMEHSYIELLDGDNNPATEGMDARMVCTGFGNLAFPLIRYDIGDVTVISKSKRCTCGRGGMIVEGIQGRVEDYIIAGDGRMIGRLDHLFKDAVHVKMAQVVQDRVGEVVILIVRDNYFDEGDERQILAEAYTRLGPQTKVSIQYVDEINRSANGKCRFVVSNIGQKQFIGQSMVGSGEI
jgi:phenylacetate-CoA ligase